MGFKFDVIGKNYFPPHCSDGALSLDTGEAPAFEPVEAWAVGMPAAITV